MIRRISFVVLAVICLVAMTACGSDDETSTGSGGDAETTSGADASAGDATTDAGSDDADDSTGDSSGDSADDEAATDAAAGGSGGEDYIDAILADLGLSGDILDDGERDCVNGELEASVGTLPSDLSLNNTELWDAVNAAADTCGAEIGL
ncbi:MAG: hypothetical protein AAFO29_12775 [Actinomycetota bacterium]